MSEEIEGLLYLLLLVKPNLTAAKIYKFWYYNRILMDYKRPKKVELEKTYKVLHEEVILMIERKNGN